MRVCVHDRVCECVCVGCECEGVSVIEREMWCVYLVVHAPVPVCVAVCCLHRYICCVFLYYLDSGVCSPVVMALECAQRFPLFQTAIFTQICSSVVTLILG